MNFNKQFILFIVGYAAGLVVSYITFTRAASYEMSIVVGIVVSVLGYFVFNALIKRWGVAATE